MKIMDWDKVVYLDLFSGVGGFTYGFLQAGMKFKHHYFSEIDKHSIAVYKYHYEEAQPVGDITAFSGDGIERPNIITFGFPCQDLSIAGKQAGLAGARSGLFFHALRLIERFRPEVFIFENVAGLLFSNEGADFEIVLRAIADIGLYECEWQLVNTRWLLPQNRDRVYFIGHLAGASRPRVFPFREGDKEFNGRTGTTSYSRTFVCGKNGGLNSHNTLIQVIQKTQGNCTIVKYDETGTLQAGGANGMDKVPNIIQLNPSLESGGQQPYQQNKVYDAEGISPALHLLSEKMNIQIINNQPRTSKLGTGGTGQLTSEDAVFALSTSPYYFSTGNIRRLTEIECERLQGFPDNWTEYGNYDGVIKKVPKTQRYEQMGNAVTTLWPKLIAERLMK